MAATAFLSMWISNTACAAMMVPIAISVIDLVLRTRTGAGLREAGGIPQDRVARAQLRHRAAARMAYAASIGGIATIIGSPPNGIASRYIAQTYDTEVTLPRLDGFGRPFTLVFLPIAWFLVTRVLFRADIGEIEGGREIRRGVPQAGPLSTGEKVDARRLRGHGVPLDLRPAARDVDVAGRAAARPDSPTPASPCSRRWRCS